MCKFAARSPTRQVALLFNRVRKPAHLTHTRIVAQQHGGKVIQNPTSDCVLIVAPHEVSYFALRESVVLPTSCCQRALQD
jgi:hypothetical protein